jgi:PPM family protein phosphatase
LSQTAGAETGAIQVNVFGTSDMGRVRKNNEDNFVVCNLTTGEVGLGASLRRHVLGPRGTLFMVADGMGGEASGEVASQLCSVTVPKRLYDNLKSVNHVSETNFVLMLREAIEYANQIIYQKAVANPNYKGMGTTTTAAALFGAHLFVAQVGDSRAYLVRNQAVVQLTRDQTFLNYLADIGAELPADPEKDSRKSILTQAVGTSENVDVKVTYAKISQGDQILVCSDGLYNMAKPDEIQRITTSHDDLAAKCKALITSANQGGGTDNITVIMAEFSGPGLSAPPSSAGVVFKEFREEDFQAPSKAEN